MRTIAIVNQKGGCGKTTTAINLSACAAARGQRVLLIDMDPQSHCALGLGIPEDRADRHIGDALVADLSKPYDPSELLWKVRTNLDVAPSSVRLAGFEATGSVIARMHDRDARLEQLLHWIRDRYDVCIIDCPPHIGLLTFNALRAATDVIIPVETSYFALRGAEKQVQTVESVGRRVGRVMSYSLLPTLYDPRLQLSREILVELRRKFDEKVLPLEIRYCSELREAAGFGQPVLEFAPDSDALRDFEQLLDWIEAHPPVAQPLPRLPVVGDRPMDGDGRGVDAGDRRVPLIETRPMQPPMPMPNPSQRDRPGGRAAELAHRARILLERHHQLQDKLSQDNRVQNAMSERNRRRSSAPSKRLRELYGVRQTKQGILFVHPGLSPNQQVCVAGDFNGWSATAHPLAFSSDLEVFQACLDLKPGRYRYRLVVDGRWFPDPYNELTELNEFGEMNSVIEVKPDPSLAL